MNIYDKSDGDKGRYGDLFNASVVAGMGLVCGGVLTAALISMMTALVRKLIGG